MLKMVLNVEIFVVILVMNVVSRFVIVMFVRLVGNRLWMRNSIELLYWMKLFDVLLVIFLLVFMWVILGMRIVVSMFGKMVRKGMSIFGKVLIIGVLCVDDRELDVIVCCILMKFVV